MVVTGIVLISLVFFILCGISSISSQLEVIAKNQTEIIRVLKNK